MCEKRTTQISRDKNVFHVALSLAIWLLTVGSEMPSLIAMREDAFYKCTQTFVLFAEQMEFNVNKFTRLPNADLIKQSNGYVSQPLCFEEFAKSSR